MRLFNLVDQMERGFAIVNFKHYSRSTGKGSIMILKAMADAMNENVLFALSPVDLYRAVTDFPGKIMAQHVDPVTYGPYTGKISMESLMDMGITMSPLNHSEFSVPDPVIAETIGRARELDFSIVLCVDSEAKARKYAPLNPEFIAYEPPELIGGNISVSKARPEIVSNVVKIGESSGVRVLVGAGIKNNEDYRMSLELGAYGILVSSGVIMAENPSASLNSLINIESGVSNGK